MAAIAEYRKKVKHVASLTFGDLSACLSVIAFIWLLGLDSVCVFCSLAALYFLLLVKRLFCWVVVFRAHRSAKIPKPEFTQWLLVRLQYK